VDEIGLYRPVAPQTDQQAFDTATQPPPPASP